MNDQAAIDVSLSSASANGLRALRRDDHPDRDPNIAPTRPVSMRDTLALVLAGGKGSRLGALTASRAKPAVPIGGKYRIIDFALSNCLNSGVPHVGVLTQYMAQSLAPHLESWGADALRRGQSIRPLRPRAHCAYAGTADAVHQNRDVIRSLAPSHVLVVAADHVYRMNYAAMLADHQRHGAQVTVGCIEVPLAEASGFGVMEVDHRERVTAFAEKPPAPPPAPGRTDVALASMGVYIFDTLFLLRALADDQRNSASTRDFGKDLIPNAVATARVQAHRLRDVARPQRAAYWRDVGTIDAYWRTSLEMAEGKRTPDFQDAAWPIRETVVSPPVALRRRPAAAADAPGHRRNVTFPGAHIAPGALVDDSVVLPGARIGKGCVIRKAIIEEGCTVPDGTRIGVDVDQDRARFEMSPHGVALVSSPLRAAA